jgi:hypothetical protein
MKKKKLEKLRKELAQLRRSPQKAAEFQSLAARLGRSLVKRGKHPMWESEFELPVLSIPDHGGKDLPIGTRNSIANQLEEDIEAWDLHLSEEGDEENDENGHGGNI